jgi:hypothetical protein
MNSISIAQGLDGIKEISDIAEGISKATELRTFIIN